MHRIKIQEISSRCRQEITFIHWQITNNIVKWYFTRIYSYQLFQIDHEPQILARNQNIKMKLQDYIATIKIKPNVHVWGDKMQKQETISYYFGMWRISCWGTLFHHDGEKITNLVYTENFISFPDLLQESFIKTTQCNSIVWNYT